MKKDENSEENAIERAQDLKLVLNGGSNRMDSATIPIKWFFSEELIKKQPKYLVFVDLTEAETKWEYIGHGKRYLAKVEDAVKFLQLFKSGKHLLIAFAFENYDKAIEMVERGGNCYRKTIYLSKVKEGNYDYDGVIASTFREFGVPKILFAQAPKSKLGKLWWNYIFWPKKPKAKDECQTKKLALLFSLPKLPLFIIGNLLYFLYYLIAPLIAFIFGYWPINIKEAFRRIINPVKFSWTLNVLPGGASYQGYLDIYKNNRDTGKRMWISPINAIVIVFLMLGILSSAINGDLKENVMFFVYIPFMVILLFVSISFFVSKRFDQIEDATFGVSIIISWIVLTVFSIFFLFFVTPLEEVADSGKYYFVNGVYLIISLLVLILGIKIFVEENDYMQSFIGQLKTRFSSSENKESYTHYLHENFSKPEVKVNLDNLPDTFQRKRTKRDLTVRFWATKAKVCRPYEED